MCAVQAIVVVFGLVALPFWPPANGRLLLVPLGADSAATLLPRILASGARLIDRGPIAGSYVVDGHVDLADVITLAAPQAGCDGAGAPG